MKPAYYGDYYAFTRHTTPDAAIAIIIAITPPPLH